MNDRLRLTLKVIGSYVFSIIFPVVAILLFDSNLSLVTMILVVAAKTTILVLRHFAQTKPFRRALTLISVVYSLVFVVVLVVGILITPANAYRLLFRSIRMNGLSPGRLVNIVIIFMAFFSSSFSGMILERGFLWPILAMALVLTALFSMMVQNYIAYIAAGVALLACLVYVAFHFLNRRFRFASLRFYIILLIFSVLVSIPIISNVKIYKVEFVDKLSKDLRYMVTTLFPQLPLAYEMPEFGFSFEDESNREKMGGAPLLSSVPIFEVTGNLGEPVAYLKTRAYDLFENFTWKITGDIKTTEPAGEGAVLEEETIKSFTPESFRSEPLGKQAGEIGIKLLLEYYSQIPFTIDTQVIRFRTASPNVYFGDLQTGFFLDTNTPLYSGDELFLERSDTLYRLKRNEQAKFLQYPMFISPTLKEMAEKYKGLSSRKQVVEQIKLDLAREFTYDLETPEIKKNENFVDIFLTKTKSGYSVHFATVFVMLARLNGVPTRYVTGFLAFIPQPEVGANTTFGGFKRVLTGLNTHAWAEVYYEGAGWQTEEPTAACNPEYYTAVKNGLLFKSGIVLNNETKRQLKGIFGSDVVLSEGEPPRQFLIDFNPVYLAFGLAPVLLCLFLIRYFYVLRYIFSKSRKTYFFLLKKTVKAQAKRNRLPRPQSIGWLEWSSELQTRLGKFGDRIDNFTDRLMKIVYGMDPVSKVDVKQAFGFYRKIARRRFKRQAAIGRKGN
ncbi:MAG: transglutaminase domain-containing protein [Spirochaetales bacterium]|nr:transglutaminase domain-containing protein [Spirochaetales bacterium]